METKQGFVSNDCLSGHDSIILAPQKWFKLCILYTKIWWISVFEPGLHE